MSRPEDPEVRGDQDDRDDRGDQDDHGDWCMPAQWRIVPRLLGADDWAG